MAPSTQAVGDDSDKTTPESIFHSFKTYFSQSLIKEHKLRLQKCYLAISDGMTLIIMAASLFKSHQILI
jgi:hypothetical protein